MLYTSGSANELLIISWIDVENAMRFLQLRWRFAEERGKVKRLQVRPLREG